MELKPKYQYTYFIKPFIIKEKEYSKYLTKILKDKNFILRTWEKEADLDVYSYFLPEIRNNIFWGFEYTKEEIENIKKQDINKQLNLLLKQNCIQFNYVLPSETPGKIGMEDGIFFGIEKINLICFNSGLCFVLVKTHIDDIKDFSDVLNFNYKFREINSKYSKLKEFEKINIQTDAFKTRKDFNNFIQEIIGNPEYNLFEDENYYVYSYTCIDGENWNDKTTFDDIKVEFWKYSNVLASNYNVDINFKKHIQPISDWEYARFGFNKNACVLLASSLNSYNYTKLPFEYENQYLYTYILALYQRIYFKKLTNDFKNGKKIKKNRKNLNQFIKNIWLKEITKDDIGGEFYKKWLQVFETENLYLETMNSYDFALKEYKKWKIDKSIKLVVMLVLICIILNIVSLGILLGNK